MRWRRKSCQEKLEEVRKSSTAITTRDPASSPPGRLYPAGGQVHRIDADAQLGGHLRGRAVEDDVLPARLPRCRLKLGLHQLQGTNGQVLLKLGLGNGGDVILGRPLDRDAGGRWLWLAALDLLPLVPQHGAQPAAKALARIVGELRQLAHEQSKDLLNEGGVSLLQTDAPRPVEQQGHVEIDESTPRRLVVRAAQLLQKAWGRGVHPLSLHTAVGSVLEQEG